MRKAKSQRQPSPEWDREPPFEWAQRSVYPQFHKAGISSKNEVGGRMTKEIGRVMGPEFIQGFIPRHPLWFILQVLKIRLQCSDLDVTLRKYLTFPVAGLKSFFQTNVL